MQFLMYVTADCGTFLSKAVNIFLYDIKVTDDEVQCLLLLHFSYVYIHNFVTRKESPNNLRRTDNTEDWKVMIAYVCNIPGT